MKFLVLIAGVLFFIIYSSFETSDCGMCSFEESDIDSFMKDYYNKCLTINRGLPNIIYNESSYNNSKYPNHKNWWGEYPFFIILT